MGSSLANNQLICEMGWHVKPVKKLSGSSARYIVKGFVPVFDEISGKWDSPEEWGDRIPGPDRLYIGDEFCLNRLPQVSELEGMLDLAREKELSITFLTPVLTDTGLVSCNGLFDCLHQWESDVEVVVNDLGVLFYLKKRYPDFQLSMGRLFNKGFKDPRLSADFETMKAVLNAASFEQSNMQSLARSLGVARLEQDLFPYADPGKLQALGLDRSIYFPFGCVTTGRACFTAGLTGNPHTRFTYGGGCDMACTTGGVKLIHPDMDLTLLQMGNTIFYPYTCQMIQGLFDLTGTDSIRLVYQGGMGAGGDR